MTVTLYGGPCVDSSRVLMSYNKFIKKRRSQNMQAFKKKFQIAVARDAITFFSDMAKVASIGFFCPFSMSGYLMI